MIATCLNPRPRVGWIVFCASALLVAVLALLPDTGWIVRRQLRGGFAGAEMTQEIYYPAKPTARETVHMKRAAARLPNNFGAQLALIIWQEERPTDKGKTYPEARTDFHNRVMARLQAMRGRWGHEPALYATYLRIACMHGGLGRKAEQQLGSATSLADAQARVERDERATTYRVPLTYWNTRPDWVVKVAEIAETGKRLDPHNAYFPVMLSACRFAQGRDREAVALLDVAGRCPTWNDYTTTEVEGTIRLRQAAGGEMSAISRVTVGAMQLYPHFTVVRSAARLAVAQAIVREQAGDVEAGFRIRRSLRRIGGIARADSPTYIGALVGSAVSDIACQRPGGAPPPPDVKGELTPAQSAARQDAQVSRYVTYLTRIGHPEEADRMREEHQRRREARRVAARGMNLGVIGGVRVFQVGIWWGVCLVCLVNALGMLIGGAAGALVARGPRARDTTPLHVAARRAFQFAVVAPLAAGMSLLAYGPDIQDAGWGLPVLVGGLTLLLPLPFLWRRAPGQTAPERRDESIQAAKIYGKVLLLTLGALTLVAVSVPLVLSGLVAVMRLSHDLSGSDQPEMQAALVQAWRVFLFASVAGGAGVFLTAGWGIVAGLRAKVPVSIGIARSFRGAALPVASVLLVLYAGAVLRTARLEARVSREYAEAIRHEGRYLAGFSHETWPGKVSEVVKGVAK